MWVSFCVYVVFISVVSLTRMSSWSIRASEMTSNEALGAKIGGVCVCGEEGLLNQLSLTQLSIKIGHLSLDMQCIVLGKHVICHCCVDNVTRDKHSTELPNGTVPVCFPSVLCSFRGHRVG